VEYSRSKIRYQNPKITKITLVTFIINQSIMLRTLFHIFTVTLLYKSQTIDRYGTVGTNRTTIIAS
jgi:hypothetical protein